MTAEAEPVHYQIRRSTRAKRLRITVRPAGVEVTAPVRARDADIVAFVSQNRRWIETKVGALRARLAAHPGSDQLVDGALVPYGGRFEHLNVVPSSRARPRVTYDDGFWIELPERVPEAARATVVETALTAWLKRQAHVATSGIVEHHGRQHDLMPTALRIKAQKRLWGSCTAKGVISLNWRLILGPPEILEYVVVHELCHLRHAHHQPPFWQLVGEVLPDYQRHRTWLRTNGHLLSLKPDRI
jgi:hypothetical protein